MGVINLSEVGTTRQQQQQLHTPMADCHAPCPPLSSSPRQVLALVMTPPTPLPAAMQLESGAGGGILAVFVVHTSSLFLLYGLAASVLAADLLTPTTPAALPAATSSAEQPGPQHPWLLVKCERVLGCCGLYLCLGAYLVLALRRPTALGLVFMAMVTVAAALPHAAFRRGAPVLLAYTAAYSTAVYWCVPPGLDNGLAPHSLTDDGLLLLVACFLAAIGSVR